MDKGITVKTIVEEFRMRGQSFHPPHARLLEKNKDRPVEMYVLVARPVRIINSRKEFVNDFVKNFNTPMEAKPYAQLFICAFIFRSKTGEPHGFLGITKFDVIEVAEFIKEFEVARTDASPEFEERLARYKLLRDA
jgi:hypothetical protein